MKCLACGVVKDTIARELYPYPDDGVIEGEPIVPLFAIECQGPPLTWDETGRVTTAEWLIGIVCHHCFHRLNPDMWITDACWAALNPITPFGLLPRRLEDEGRHGGRFKVEAYAQDLP
jgi:hypothetical protein